jgi:cell division protease FtsH
VIFGHLSTGAADDLRKVTDIARSMVTKYGMSEKIGSVAYDHDQRSFLTGADMPVPHEQDYGEKTATVIDDEVRQLVQSAMNRAVGILTQKRDVLERSARRLLEKETLDERELADLIGTPLKAAAE